MAHFLPQEPAVLVDTANALNHQEWMIASEFVFKHIEWLQRSFLWNLPAGLLNVFDSFPVVFQNTIEYVVVILVILFVCHVTDLAGLFAHHDICVAPWVPDLLPLGIHWQAVTGGAFKASGFSFRGF